jgi:hypothetical protein
MGDDGRAGLAADQVGAHELYIYAVSILILHFSRLVDVYYDIPCGQFVLACIRFSNSSHDARLLVEALWEMLNGDCPSPFGRTSRKIDR